MRTLRSLSDLAGVCLAIAVIATGVVAASLVALLLMGPIFEAFHPTNTPGLAVELTAAAISGAAIAVWGFGFFVVLRRPGGGKPSADQGGTAPPSGASGTTVPQFESAVVVLAALAAIVLLFMVAALKFGAAQDVTTALGAVTGVLGTVVGAFFGIRAGTQASQQTADVLRGQLERAQGTSPTLPDSGSQASDSGPQASGQSTT